MVTLVSKVTMVRKYNLRNAGNSSSNGNPKIKTEVSNEGNYDNRGNSRNSGNRGNQRNVSNRFANTPKMKGCDIPHFLLYTVGAFRALQSAYSIRSICLYAWTGFREILYWRALKFVSAHSGFG
jgi:hypothetical protein